jgi:hypothetical protein
LLILLNKLIKGQKMKLQIIKLMVITTISLAAVSAAQAQVKAINYELKYNAATGLHDCYIIIKKGHAVTMRDRVQFNSQIAVLVPTGSPVEMEKTYMPLEDNQQYTGLNPIQWKVEKPLMGPSSSPKYDFYSITPNLFPSAFYNDLAEGDRIKLFSLKVSCENSAAVRLYNKATDPDATALGMKGRDFNNSFSIGGPEEDYVGK